MKNIISSFPVFPKYLSPSPLRLMSVITEEKKKKRKKRLSYLPNCAKYIQEGLHWLPLEWLFCFYMTLSYATMSHLLNIGLCRVFFLVWFMGNKEIPADGTSLWDGDLSNQAINSVYKWWTLSETTYGIIESFRLKKTLKIIQSNH